MKQTTSIDNHLDKLFEKVSNLTEQARKQVATTANIAEVKTLSNRLTVHFGDGWSYENLKLRRRLYYGVFKLGKRCLPNSERKR